MAAGLAFNREVYDDTYSPYFCDCNWSTILTKTFRNHLRYCKAIELRLEQEALGRDRALDHGDLVPSCEYGSVMSFCCCQSDIHCFILCSRPGCCDPGPAGTSPHHAGGLSHPEAGHLV